MIRPFTLVTILLAAGSGLYLYQAKQQARVLDRQIHDIRAETEATHQRAEVLRAEYTLLNDPTRLAELVSAHLPDLRPTQPPQWTSMAELDKRLPPVGEATAPPAPLEPAAAEAVAAEPAHPVPAANVPPPHPSVVAHAPLPHPIVAIARDPAPAPAAAPHPVAHAAAVPVTVPDRAASHPAMAAPATTPILATLRQVPRADPVSTPAGPPLPVVASALGMARTMMAVTQANAATLPPLPGGGAR